MGCARGAGCTDTHRESVRERERCAKVPTSQEFEQGRSVGRSVLLPPPRWAGVQRTRRNSYQATRAVPRTGRRDGTLRGTLEPRPHDWRDRWLACIVGWNVGTIAVEGSVVGVPEWNECTGRGIVIPREQNWSGRRGRADGRQCTGEGSDIFEPCGSVGILR